MRSPDQPNAGFSLMELVIAVSVMSILVGVSVPAFRGIQANAKTQKILATYETLRSACEQHYSDTGSLAREYSSEKYAEQEFHDLSTDQTTNGWAGPYIDHPLSTADNPFGGNVFVYNKFKGGSAKPKNSEFRLLSASGPASTGNGNFIAFQNVPESVAQKIDEALDRDLKGNWKVIGRVQWNSKGWLMIFLLDE